MNIAPKQSILSLLAVVVTSSSYADSPPPPPVPVPVGFPIDGNIIFLAIAGIIYGLYILKKLKFQAK